ncbi:MAG: hypothetical protein CVV27_00585 [Candidatus Melainabacteria bacterium HGW-Melainabacteria-1]|nr:MAG: hypothetical protein CVV27_00585 [Candidatus Melainabacteria bacterium HGW-Melainabacteria-1]
MIEKLLRFQTIPGPYLGENRPVPTGQVVQNFSTLLPKPEPLPPALQSQSLQLQLQVRSLAQGQPAAQAVAQSQAPLTPASYLHTPLRLSQTTIIQIQQHPLHCRLDLRLEDLLLLEMLKRQVRKRPADHLVPSPFAQLSWLPVDRPLARLAPSRRRLEIRGLSFMRFRFAWEDDESPADDGQERQPSEREQDQTRSDEDSLLGFLSPHQD